MPTTPRITHNKTREAMSKRRPKGVIGEWYTLTSDFDGWYDGTENRKAGFTWQCKEVDSQVEPMIEGVSIGYSESYRLATPEEIARAKGEDPQPSKPSKEAREFWERYFLKLKVDENNCTTDDLAELADEAMAEWQKRFE